MGESCLSSQLWLLSCSRSLRERLASIAPFTRASKGSLTTGTKKCASSGGRRPSFYLLAASLLLFVSAVLGLSGGKVTEDAKAETLLALGWQKTDRLPCTNPTLPGNFYEIEGESKTVEAYALTASTSLAASLPLPAQTSPCREISEPHFIQEIP